MYCSGECVDVLAVSVIVCVNIVWVLGLSVMQLKWKFKWDLQYGFFRTHLPDVASVLLLLWCMLRWRVFSV